MLVLITLHQSEWGLSGTVWNKLAAALALFWVYRNLRLSFFHSVYIVPIILAFVSVGVNYSAFSINGLWSVLATAIGLALFAIRPAAINRILLRRLVLAYLLVIVAMSLVLFLQNSGTDAGTHNYFHVNRASSAWLFYQCVVLSLFFVESRTKWLLVLAFGLLMITTGSRGGIVAVGGSVGLFSLLGRRELLVTVTAIFKRLLALGAILIIGLIIAQRLIPEHLSFLLARFSITRGATGLIANRVAVWESALTLWLESELSTLFGAGPTALGSSGAGAHNSYLEAAAVHGIVFLLASMFVFFLWSRSLVRRGHVAIIALVFPLLVYGATDSFLFTGTRQLWYLLAFVGIYLHSQSTGAVAGIRSKQTVALEPDSRHVERGA